VKGVKLQGVITAFDSFSIQLRRGNGGQLVYKHAISTIAPTQWPEGFMADAEPNSAAEGNLQDQFLANAQELKSPMSLFLVNGVMLEGKVACFDQYCVVLERGGQAQLIYKHAISTLQPHGPMAPDEEEVAEETAA